MSAKQRKNYLHKKHSNQNGYNQRPRNKLTCTVGELPKPNANNEDSCSNDTAKQQMSRSC